MSNVIPQQESNNELCHFYGSAADVSQLQANPQWWVFSAGVTLKAVLNSEVLISPVDPFFDWL